MPAPSDEQGRKRWACLRADPHRQAARIKQVYEVDPLACSKCGCQMKIISFIGRDQTEVIEKILRH